MRHCDSMACCLTVSHGGMTLLSQGSHDSTRFITLLIDNHFFVTFLIVSLMYWTLFTAQKHGGLFRQWYIVRRFIRLQLWQTYYVPHLAPVCGSVTESTIPHVTFCVCLLPFLCTLCSEPEIPIMMTVVQVKGNMISRW